MADDTTQETTGTEQEPAETPAEATDQADLAAELERTRAALKNANKEAEKHRLKLKEVDDAKLSEIEKAKRDAEEASKELEKLRKDSLRQKVALNAGLPAKWVGRLQGDTEEELAADAAEILADLNRTKKPAPDPSQGPRETAVVSGKAKGLAEAQKRFGTTK